MGSSAINAIKANFFDARKVQLAVETGMRKKMARFGAFVRTSAKSSLRKRKGISKPGTTPTSWTGLLRKFILFSYDASSKSVVIGPVPFSSNATVPRLLEEGGTVQGDGREIWITNDVGRDAAGKFVSGGRTKKKLEGTIVYEPRPYMKPARDRELPGFLQSLKDSL